MLWYGKAGQKQTEGVPFQSSHRTNEKLQHANQAEVFIPPVVTE